MADLKVSQLTEATSLVTSDVFPVVNAGETKKVSVNSLSNSLPITTFVQGASGNWGGDVPYIVVSHQPPYTGPGDNLPNATDTYLAWDSSTTNDSSIFELVNSNTTNARIQIKSTGIYDVQVQAVYFDLWDNNRFSAHLDSNINLTGGGWSRILTLFQHVFGSTASSPPAHIVYGHAQINVATANLYYSVAFNPSINTPFPATINNVATNILIRKIGV